MNNDLISREALKERIYEKFDGIQCYDGSGSDIISECEEVIDNAPAVEEKSYAMGYQDGAEDGLQGIRPQGNWIIMGEEQGALGINYKIRKCDKCGWEHSLVIPDNFCPNCGADMRKEAE